MGWCADDAPPHLSIPVVFSQLFYVISGLTDAGNQETNILGQRMSKDQMIDQP